jgi:D123
MPIESFRAHEDYDSDFDADGSAVDEDEGPSYSFPELDSRIREVIERYEGSVFPKLNWSSPQVRKEIEKTGDPAPFQMECLSGCCLDERGAALTMSVTGRRLSVAQVVRLHLPRSKPRL